MQITWHYVCVRHGTRQLLRRKLPVPTPTYYNVFAHQFFSFKAALQMSLEYQHYGRFVLEKTTTNQSPYAHNMAFMLLSPWIVAFLEERNRCMFSEWGEISLIHMSYQEEKQQEKNYIFGWIQVCYCVQEHLEISRLHLLDQSPPLIPYSPPP